jgi:hypothetical protein
MPTRTSGMPNFAVSTPMRMSQAAASSMPKPRHQPLMRAMTGTGNIWIDSFATCVSVCSTSACFGIEVFHLGDVGARDE